MQKIQSALISVFYKDNLAPLVRLLNEQGVKLYSTGGTQQFISSLGIEVIPVEAITDYPSIFGGRVKTLHPKIFGGILQRRNEQKDLEEATQYKIPQIDLVIVDLYPFEETVTQTKNQDAIIEKIDIGGISLIRAAAKNFKDVLVVASREQYTELTELLLTQNGYTTIFDRQKFAAKAFAVSSHYDTQIFNYFNSQIAEPYQYFKESIEYGEVLRYGENPHQQGVFFGDLSKMFDQLQGKQLSYNNLVDIDSGVALIDEFNNELAFAILKHNNACGVATGLTCKEAYLKAFVADTISAFGGVLLTNTTVDADAASEIDKLFIEVLVAPEFTNEALQILKRKENRILLRRKPTQLAEKQFKTLLNGVILQDKDLKTETAADLKVVTQKQPTPEQVSDLIFAAKVCKHTKSNTIVLAVDGQLFASGVGQTSRVDSLRQALEKAKTFGFDLSKAVMASDAFFPFPDCVEIANQAGIKAVIQPGGSIKDKASIEYCDANEMTMVFTGIRHFKH